MRGRGGGREWGGHDRERGAPRATIGFAACIHPAATAEAQPDLEWCEAMASGWQRDHAEAVEARRERAELEARAAQGPLPRDAS